MKCGVRTREPLLYSEGFLLIKRIRNLLFDNGFYRYQYYLWNDLFDIERN